MSPTPGNDNLVVVIVIIAMSPPATTIPAPAIVVIVVGVPTAVAGAGATRIVVRVPTAVVVSAATGPATEEAAQQPTPTPRAVRPVVPAAAFQEIAKLAEHRHPLLRGVAQCTERRRHPALTVARRHARGKGFNWHPRHSPIPQEDTD